MQISESLKKKAVYIQCTFANVFIKPNANRGYCMRSYDRRLIAQLYADNHNEFKKYNFKFQGVKIDDARMIAVTTGMHTTDEKGVKWIEVYPMYCDRAVLNYGKGWFRESDVYFAGKFDAEPNPDDVDFINTKGESSSNWLAWLTGAFTVLKILG